MVKMYDTNALLNLGEEAFRSFFFISQQTLIEIENIKTSYNKDPETKYKARKVARLLNEHQDLYNVIMTRPEWQPDSPDNIICKAAASTVDEVTFITDDLNCKNIAKNIYKLHVDSTHATSDYVENTGFVSVNMDDADMATFYQDLTINRYKLLTNQYLIVRNAERQVVDLLKWNGESYVNLQKNSAIVSAEFGTVKPYNKDIYQQMAIDSLLNNQMTVIKGHAGTGKSYLAMGAMFSMLERHKIDRIIVFCNTVATLDSAKLGYYPGTRTEKLLDSSIGNMLGAKIGSSYELERLINEERLVLMPMSDIRGYDTSNMNAAIYITEAQNMNIDLMKLALQRVGEDCRIIIDGDYNTQVDMASYGGVNNGMRRVSEVFRGQPFYGEVELQNIYRSRIADIAERM